MWRKREHFYTVGGFLISTTTIEFSMEAPQRLDMDPLCDPALSLLSIYAEALKSSYYNDTCVPTVIVAHFTVTKLEPD